MLNALLWNLLLTAGLAVVLAMLCRLPSLHRRPALRCWLWMLLVVKLILPPLINVPLLPATHHEVVPFVPMMKMDPVVEDTNMALAAIETKHLSVASKAAVSPEPSSEVPVPWLALLLAVSLVGTGVLAMVYGQRTLRLYRWIKRAGVVDARLVESCASIAAALKIRKTVQSCVVETRTTPLLWPWGQPLVAMPRELFDAIDPRQCQNIVAHELAHFLRRDHWANLFVFIVKMLFWWNPIIWWADRELHTAQELCCDAIAIDCCQANRHGYATTLLKAMDFIAEPQMSHVLAPGMGSRRSILMRFEMIGETRLAHKLSRWTFLLLLALGTPLAFMPIRAQEIAAKGRSVPMVVSEAIKIENSQEAKMIEAETENSKDVRVAEAKTEAADAKSNKNEKNTEDDLIDPQIRELGRAALKRITTWMDEVNLTLKDGEIVRMKVKKNLTPIAEILITAHLVEDGTRFELEGIDDNGEVVPRTKTEGPVIHDGKESRINLKTLFDVDERKVFSKIQLTPKRSDYNTVIVNVKALFTYLTTREEMEAINRIQGKLGTMSSDFSKIAMYIREHHLQTGSYPMSLDELKQALPKDTYSPNGVAYHYELLRTGFILSSCGKDEIYGNEDDVIYYNGQNMIRSGHRDEIYPLENE
jgi:beta-lactamase regulating signal transducer with metallopeptidase domain